MSQAIALWYGHWPGHVSNRKSWFILVREDFLDQEWNGSLPFGKYGYRNLTIGLPFPSEQEAFSAALQFHDPENLFKESNMKQVGFAVKYTSGEHTGKYWGWKDHWVVSDVPYVFGAEDAKKHQAEDEGCEKEITPIFVEDT